MKEEDGKIEENIYKIECKVKLDAKRGLLAADEAEEETTEELEGRYIKVKGGEFVNGASGVITEVDNIEEDTRVLTPSSSD